ncbi:calsequestrin-2-like [Rhopilema esculentum]|uniref:calsequestrin-2-like n=1 Tax=Rhopilema esculentum TaxID=499914 RepID=UPI0031D3A847
MVPYLSRMFEQPVTNIISKTGKKNFDNVQLPKVVAYVEKEGQEYTELVKTAMSFQPMIQFHAVFDAKIAKSLQLKKINSLLFIKPFEKTLKLPSAVTWKENKLVDFLNQNKKQSIKKMLLENIHEIWSPDMKGYIIAVFAKIENPVGNRFFSLVKSLVRSVGDNEKLNFVWIDPDPFPAMKEYWQSTFNVDPTKPSIGAVDLNEQASTWLLQKEDKELKLSDLKKWCNNLLAGKLKLVPLRGKGKDRPESTNNENANTESNIQTGKDDNSGNQEAGNQGTLSKDENKDEL